MYPVAGRMRGWMLVHYANSARDVRQDGVSVARWEAENGHPLQETLGLARVPAQRIVGKHGVVHRVH